MVFPFSIIFGLFIFIDSKLFPSTRTSVLEINILSSSVFITPLLDIHSTLLSPLILEFFMFISLLAINSTLFTLPYNSSK